MANTKLVTSEWSNAITVTSGHIHNLKPTRLDLSAKNINNKTNFYIKPISVNGVLYFIYENKNGKVEISKYNKLTDTTEVYFETALDYQEDICYFVGPDDIFIILKSYVNGPYNLYRFIVSTKNITNINMSSYYPDFIHRNNVSITGIFHNETLFLYYGSESASVCELVFIDLNENYKSSYDIDGRNFVTSAFPYMTKIGEFIYITNGSNGNPIVRFDANSINTNATILDNITLPSDHYIWEMLNLSDSLLFIIAHFEQSNATGLPIFSFMTYDPTNQVFTNLQNTPGISDLEDASFGVLNDELFISSVIKNKVYQPEISSSTLEISLMENLLQTYRGCFFVHNNYFCHIAVKSDPITTYENNFYIQLTDNITKEKQIIPISFPLASKSVPADPVKCYYNGKIYFYGGLWFNPDTQTTQYCNHVFEIDPITGIATLLNTDGLKCSPALMLPIENKLYCIGGYESDQNIIHPFRYFDLITKTWTNLTTPPELLRYSQCRGCVSPDLTEIILWGGSSNSIAYANLITPIKINLSTQQVTTLPILPPAFNENAQFVTHDSKIYAIPYSISNKTFQFYYYHTINNAWTFDKEIVVNNTMLFTSGNVNTAISNMGSIWTYNEVYGGDDLTGWGSCILGFTLSPTTGTDLVLYNDYKHQINIKIFPPLTNVGIGIPVEAMVTLTYGIKTISDFFCNTTIKSIYDEDLEEDLYLLTFTDFPEDSGFNDPANPMTDIINLKIKLLCLNTGYSIYSNEIEVINNINTGPGGKE